MLNYSLEVFYSPTLLQLYYTTVLIMFAVNTVLFVFISYAIIFHGMILEVYRWLLLIIFILSYIIDFALASGHIVPLLPATIIYFDGIIGRFFDAKLMVGILLSTIAIKLLAILFVIMYRYAMTTTGRLQEFFQTPTNLWGILLVLMFFGCSPMLILTYDTEDPYTYIDEEVPALIGIPLGSNVIYIPRTTKLYIVSGLLGFLLICGCSITWLYCYQMDQGIRKMKNQVTENVNHLQRMMFISTLIEAILFQLFIAWPLFIADLMVVFAIPYGSYWCYVLFSMMSFQTTISAISQCYFMRPFREAAKTLLLKFSLLKNNFQTTTVVSLQNNGNLNN